MCEWGSDLYVLQSQVFSVASSICTKLRPPASNCWEDTQNAFHCHVYVNIHVCAAKQVIDKRDLNIFTKGVFLLVKSDCVQAEKLFQWLILFSMQHVAMSSLADQGQSCVPADLIGQVFGPAASVLGGVFTGHVAGGEDVTTQLPWVLRIVGVISDHPAHIFQYLAVWKREREKKRGIKKTRLDLEWSSKVNLFLHYCNCNN